MASRQAKPGEKIIFIAKSLLDSYGSDPRLVVEAPKTSNSLRGLTWFAHGGILGCGCCYPPDYRICGNIHDIQEQVEPKRPVNADEFLKRQLNDNLRSVFE